jgi:F-type H+-transporting ATPase subunit b
MSLFLLAAEEAEGGTSNPILPASNELFWGIISFGALYLLVRYVLLPPVQRVMNDRRATIQADRDAADAARAKVASAGSELADQLAGVRAEASAIVDAARAEAEAERERLVSRAEREVTAMQEITDQEIAREREEAMAALRPQVAELAVGAASRIMNRQISLDDALPVVNRQLDNPN